MMLSITQFQQCFFNFAFSLIMLREGSRPAFRSSGRPEHGGVTPSSRSELVKLLCNTGKQFDQNLHFPGGNVLIIKTANRKN